MSRDLPEAPILLLNVQDVKTKLCAKSGFSAIYTFKNITNKFFFPVKAFDPGLKVLEIAVLSHSPLNSWWLSRSSGGPKDRQAEPHTHIGKETHELIFSCWSWLAVLLVGAYARRRRRYGGVAQDSGHPPNNRLTETCSLSLVYGVRFWYMASCYDQLTPVKSSYPLTIITWPYRGLKLTAHRGHMFY